MVHYFILQPLSYKSLQSCSFLLEFTERRGPQMGMNRPLLSLARPSCGVLRGFTLFTCCAHSSSTECFCLHGTFNSNGFKSSHKG